MRQIPPIPDFFNPAYLLKGTVKQRRVYALLQGDMIFELLRSFKPCLAGTIPLGIDTRESDADILCEAKNHQEFHDYLIKKFSHHKAFEVYATEKQGITATVASFLLQPVSSEEGDLRVEIFGQPIAVTHQNGYRHLVVESRLLSLADVVIGEYVREEIRLLKLKGVKTEPAFAEFFGIKGNPYQALLELYSVTDDELLTIILQKSVHKKEL